MASRRSTCCTPTSRPLAAFFVFAIPAARQQQRLLAHPARSGSRRATLDVPRLVIVVLVLAGRDRRQCLCEQSARTAAGRFPYIGATVIGILLLLTPWRRPDWSVLPAAIKGSVFLLSLVLSASMMPVERLPRGFGRRPPSVSAWFRRCSTTSR